jgi:hypothetical protein
MSARWLCSVTQICCLFLSIGRLLWSHKQYVHILEPLITVIFNRFFLVVISVLSLRNDVGNLAERIRGDD